MLTDFFDTIARTYEAITYFASQFQPQYAFATHTSRPYSSPRQNSYHLPLIFASSKSSHRGVKNHNTHIHQPGRIVKVGRAEVDLSEIPEGMNATKYVAQRAGVSIKAARNAMRNHK